MKYTQKNVKNGIKIIKLDNHIYSFFIFDFIF